MFCRPHKIIQALPFFVFIGTCLISTSITWQKSEESNGMQDRILHDRIWAGVLLPVELARPPVPLDVRPAVRHRIVGGLRRCYIYYAWLRSRAQICFSFRTLRISSVSLLPSDTRFVQHNQVCFVTSLQNGYKRLSHLFSLHVEIKEKQIIISDFFL